MAFAGFRQGLSGGSQSTLDNALNHPESFVPSAVALIHAYHLDGIDVDFEPSAFFGPGQGDQYARLMAALRQALGAQAFISIEVPGDWDTLRSIDCSTHLQCRDNLVLIAADTYVSLMGYSYHSPIYPGGIEPCLRPGAISGEMRRIEP